MKWPCSSGNRSDRPGDDGRSWVVTSRLLLLTFPEMAAIAAKVRALSPFGPIFGKELRVTARRKRSYLLRVFYLTALLLVLAMVWSETRVAYGPGNAAARAQAQEQLGQAFFYCFVA